MTAPFPAPESSPSTPTTEAVAEALADWELATLCAPGPRVSRIELEQRIARELVIQHDRLIQGLSIAQVQRIAAYAVLAVERDLCTHDQP